MSSSNIPGAQNVIVSSSWHFFFSRLRGQEQSLPLPFSSLFYRQHESRRKKAFAQLRVQ